MKSIKQFLNEGTYGDDPLYGKPKWERAFWEKGTFENKIWDLHYKYQCKGYPYVSKIVNKLEHEFPFVEEWVTPAPNMNKDCTITAKCDGKAIASINLDEKDSNGYPIIKLYVWADFFDELRRFEKKMKKADPYEEKWKEIGLG